MRAVLVGVGSNLGAREAAIRAAYSLLDARAGIEVERVSPIYETAPLGPPQGEYLNAAFRLQTSLPAPELLGALLRTERRLGRVRGAGERWGPRSIDLDLLWDERGAFESAELRVPHPELTRRDFVLAPMLDVAPELRAQYGAALDAVGGAPSKWQRESSVAMRFADARMISEVEADSLADACALCVGAPSAARAVRSTRHASLAGTPDGFARTLRDLFRTGFVAHHVSLSHCSETQWLGQFHGINTGVAQQRDVRLVTTSGAAREVRATLEISAAER